jgi:hypothetical protein
MSDAPTDSPVLLYGILASEAGMDAALQAVLERSGVRGAPLTLLSCGPLAALASPFEDRSALRQPDVDTVLTYKETIDAAYEARTLIPLRFGTWANTPGEARSLLTERAAACREQLDALEGHVEMGLRLTLNTEYQSGPPSEDADAPSGTAYLRARKQRYDRVRRPLDETLKQYRKVLASRVAADSTTDRSDDETASAAFLVPRSETETFVQCASEVEPEAGVEAQVVGPWAPFSFASLSL